jgi:hypothetical protein
VASQKQVLGEQVEQVVPGENQFLRGPQDSADTGCEGEGLDSVKSDYQIRQEIAGLKKQLRERKRKTLGLPSSKPATYSKDGHEYLAGVLAHTQRRIDVFTNAGGEVVWWDKTDPRTVEELRPATCQGCVEPHLVGWDSDEGNWHHNCPLRKKCDSAACALYVCIPWHTAFHGRVIATRQIER